jgi:hypothetical protein
MLHGLSLKTSKMKDMARCEAAAGVDAYEIESFQIYIEFTAIFTLGQQNKLQSISFPHVKNTAANPSGIHLRDSTTSLHVCGVSG